MIDKTAIKQLLTWYDAHATMLPWRANRDPYRIWLSEIMLQQTRIETVIPYYIRFLEAYPTIADLATSPQEDVLKLWEGLGYYSRARNLHACARIVVEQYGGKFPDTVAELQKLPGIGRYTAGAIASIAFGVVAPLVDGNVMRVFARLVDLPDDITRSTTQKYLWQLAENWLPKERTGDYNQALMELGRMVCKPRRPLCEACPLQAHCAAYARGTQHQRPVKRKKAPLPHYNVTAGIIWNDSGQLLIAQRPTDGLLGGLWEFPGGKLEEGETLEQCLQRELREELAIVIEVGELFTVVNHAFTHFKITLHAFTCRHIGREPQAIEAQDWRWVSPEQLDDYAFGKADRAVIAEMKRRHDMLF